uniref:Uncharacterized protein n=1 Tax=Rhizophora mucronata TaxID=61149 RepID=A0A2P2Q7C5_RHIMU
MVLLSGCEKVIFLSCSIYLLRDIVNLASNKVGPLHCLCCI